MDLFSFGLQEAQYVDRFASFSNFDRFRKMNVKANVNMIVDGFTPFSAAKRLKTPTKTIVSIDDTNIDETEGGVTLSCNSSGKSKTVIINNRDLAVELENVHEHKHFDYVEQNIKYAYGAFSNQTRVSAFLSSFTKDHADGNISDEYMQNIETAHNLMKAVTHDYVPDFSDTIIGYDSQAKCVPANEIDKFILHALNGVPVGEKSLIHDVVSVSNKSSAAFADCEKALHDVILDDLIAKIATNDCNADAGTLPVLRVFNAHDKQPEEEDNGKEACSVGNGQVSYDESPSFSEAPTQKDNSFDLTNDTLDEQSTSNEDECFFRRRDYENELELHKLDHVVNALYESLVGRDGKKKSQSPAKKLNARAIASDISENIYVSKSPIDGKNLHINIVVDTSGSMSGDYIDDAVKIVYVFNELAHRGVVRGNIMLSCSRASGMWSFPMKRELVPQISAHNGGEGFKHTMAIRWREMQAADFNIALTDGHLTDGHISLDDFESAGIEVTGMYVVRDIKNSDITKYTGNLSKWFHNSIVRTSVDECIYSIVDQSILQLGHGK